MPTLNRTNESFDVEGFSVLKETNQEGKYCKLITFSDSDQNKHTKV